MSQLSKAFRLDKYLFGEGSRGDEIIIGFDDTFIFGHGVGFESVIFVQYKIIKFVTSFSGVFDRLKHVDGCTITHSGVGFLKAVGRGLESLVNLHL